VTYPAVNESADSVQITQNFRSHVGHISKQSGVFFAGTLFTTALGYLFKVYLARVLGAEDLGLYALGMTFVGFLGPFTSLGLVESAVRFASAYRASSNWEKLHSLLWRGGAILFGTNLVSGIVLLLVGGRVAVRFYHSTALAHYIPWFAMLMLVGGISTFYSRVLAGYRQVARRTLITNFIGTPANMLLSIILISVGWKLKGYLCAQVLSGSVICCLILAMVWKFTPSAARPRSHRTVPLDAEVWSFSATAVGVLFLEFIIAHVDKVALGFFRNAREVGIYSISAAIVAYVSLILNSVNQVFSPMIADLHTRNDMVMLGRLYRTLTRWILGLTLPLAIIIMVFSVPILRVFGRDFQAGWPILIIGTSGQLINSGVGSVGLLLLMSGNQQRLLRVQSIMAAVMVIASVSFIPIWGGIGAALAGAITNAGMNLMNLMEVRRVLRLSPFGRSYLRLLAPTLGALIVAILVKHEMHWFHFDLLCVGAGILLSYLVFSGLVLSMGLDDDDRLIAGAIWSRVRGSRWIGKGLES
jgi:O-antigen/teichoic acid export membrane protein